MFIIRMNFSIVYKQSTGLHTHTHTHTHMNMYLYEMKMVFMATDFCVRFFCQSNFFPCWNMEYIVLLCWPKSTIKYCTNCICIFMCWFQPYESLLKNAKLYTLYTRCDRPIVWIYVVRIFFFFGTCNFSWLALYSTAVFFLST